MNLYYIEYTCIRVKYTQKITEFFQAVDDVAARTEANRIISSESNCGATNVKLFLVGTEISL